MARKRSCPKCSWYSTAFPIESARMSIPSREERSKYASQPSSPRMNPQPSFLFSRVTEPRISAPLFPIAERQSRFNRSPATSLLTASFQPWPAIPSIWQRLHLHRLLAKPTILNPVTDPLARRKRVKLRSTQSRFSEKHLRTVITANHAFLLVAIDVPDQSLHVSNSRSLRNTQPPFPFARSENDPFTFAQPAQRSPVSERPLLQPRRLAELHDPGPTGSCRNYVFRILAGCGWAPDRRLYINASGKLRPRGEKDPVRHF